MNIIWQEVYKTDKLTEKQGRDSLELAPGDQRQFPHKKNPRVNCLLTPRGCELARRLLAGPRQLELTPAFAGGGVSSEVKENLQGRCQNTPQIHFIKEWLHGSWGKIQTEDFEDKSFVVVVIKKI